MAVAASIRLLATIVATADVGATLTADVYNAADSRATLTAEVSRALVEAYEGRSIRTGFKVKLDGVWVPAADLLGDVEISESLDSPMAFATFRLVGGAWSPLVTEKTWTRKAVEIWWLNGPPGRTREELRFAGWVRTGDAAGGPGPIVTVSCVNEAGLYDRWELCHEIEPLAGMRRGEIAAELCADAGLTAVDFPDGAEYTKPVQAVNARLFDYLQPFVEPEGWKLRFAGTTRRTLQAYTPALKEAPEAPDDIWRGDDVVSVEIRPPADVPSRWVVRGFGSVYVDEAGQESKVTVTEIKALYAPKIAVERQETDGSTTTLSYAAPTASLRVIQRITDSVVSQNGKVLSQDTLEQGWYNPSEAHLVTNTGTDGYSYRQVFISEDGRFVQNWSESFRDVGRRRTAITYDVDGSAVAERTEVYRYFLRTCGVRALNSAVINVVNAYVHNEENSYLEIVENYGLAEVHEAAREFLDDGSESVIAVDSYGYYAPRATVDPSLIEDDYYVLYNGQGQNWLVANWKKYQRTEKRNLMSEGSKVGELEQTYKYVAYHRIGGSYEWGDFESDWTEERFLLSDQKLVQYDALSTGADAQYQKTTYAPGQSPKTETFSGRVPPVRYRWSPWVVLRQQPIELAIDDPVVEGWFGFGRTVVQNDHIQTMAEAQRVLDDRRARALAYQVTIERHESLARLADTVLLLSPDHRFSHRALVTGLRVRRNLQAPAQLGSYDLEVRL